MVLLSSDIGTYLRGKPYKDDLIQDGCPTTAGPSGFAAIWFNLGCRMTAGTDYVQLSNLKIAAVRQLDLSSASVRGKMSASSWSWWCAAVWFWDGNPATAGAGGVQLSDCEMATLRELELVVCSCLIIKQLSMSNDCWTCRVHLSLKCLQAARLGNVQLSVLMAVHRQLKIAAGIYLIIEWLL